MTVTALTMKSWFYFVKFKNKLQYPKPAPKMLINFSLIEILMFNVRERPKVIGSIFLYDCLRHTAQTFASAKMFFLKIFLKTMKKYSINTAKYLIRNRYFISWILILLISTAVLKK